MISNVSKSEQEGLNDNFTLNKEEFKVEVIRNEKVEKTLSDKIDFSELKNIFDKLEDERFI